LLLSQRPRLAEKVRAYGWVAREWPSIMAARQQTQAQRAVPDHTILAACISDLDYGQVGRSPAVALAERVCNPMFRVLHRVARGVVRW
jgi:hypothetical protein